MPEVLEKGVRYTIGLPEGLKRTIETDRIQTNFDFSEYRERFFPDMICSPFLLLSEVYLKTVMMYQPDVLFKGIKLWNKESGINVTYMLVILDGLECISDKTQFNSVGNRILKLVLNKEKVDTEAVFRFKECDKNGIIGRMDFVESILRRGVKGIKLTEIEVA